MNTIETKIHSTLETFNEDNNNEKYLISNSGVVKSISHPFFGNFVIKPDYIPLLPEVKEGFILGLPKKMPFEFFEKTFAFFTEIYKYCKGEAMMQFYWDCKEQKYFMDCPIQTVSPAHLNFERNQALLNDPNIIKVLDIHSHNVMGAFFSSTDDRDEQKTGLYGVIGLITNKRPAFKFRMSLEGKFKELEMSEIFEIPEDFEKRMESLDKTLFEEVWLDKVTNKDSNRYSSWDSGQVSLFGRGYGYGYNYGYGYGYGGNRNEVSKNSGLYGSIYEEEFLNEMEKYSKGDLNAKHLDQIEDWFDTFPMDNGVKMFPSNHEYEMSSDGEIVYEEIQTLSSENFTDFIIKIITTSNVEKFYQILQGINFTIIEVEGKETEEVNSEVDLSVDMVSDMFEKLSDEDKLAVTSEIINLYEDEVIDLLCKYREVLIEIGTMF